MGIKGDFEEIATVWRSSPWRVKAYLATSAFLASGSIASLSEVVFKWKGFILDGVNSYKQWIREPLAIQLKAVLNVSPPYSSIDVAIVYFLFVTSLIRVLVFQKRIAASDISLLTMSIAVIVVSVFSEKAIEDPFHLAILGAAMLAYMAASKKGAARIVGLSYLLSPLLIVLLAAAVNVGLVK